MQASFGTTSATERASRFGQTARDMKEASKETQDTDMVDTAGKMERYEGSCL